MLAVSCGQPGPIDPVRPPAEVSLGPLLQDTIDRYVAQVEAQPDSAAMHGRLALLYEANELTTEAAMCYANALALDPDEPVWNYRLGIAKVNLGELDEGTSRLLVACDEMGDSAAVFHRAGYLYLDAGDLEQALATFRIAVALASDTRAPLAEASVGETLVALDRSEEAIEPLEHALEVIPNLKPALYAYGLALRSLGRIDEAEKALNEGLGAGRALIPHESGSELTSLKLAYAERISFAAQLSSSGDTGRGIRTLRELLEYYPGDEVILSNLASIHLQLEDWESARQILTEVSESGSSQFGVWLNLATAEAGLGNLPEARKAIDRAVALAPGQARGHLTRAEICAKQRDLVAARESALKAVELEPEDAQAFLILAEANTRLGQPAEACAAFERVNALNAKFLPSRVSAASLYLSAGRFQDAERLIMEAEAIAPGHERVVQVRSRLEQLRRGAGR